MDAVATIPLLGNYYEQPVPLYFSIFRGIIAAFSQGLLGFHSTFEVAGGPHPELTDTETFWFNNLSSLCLLIGYSTSAVILHKYGRRTALICGLLPNLFAWSCFYFGPNAIVIRIISGISRGLIGVCGQIYGCECLFFDHPRIRESFKIWPGVLASLSMLILQTVAGLLSYEDIAIVAFVLTLVELILVYAFLPESPAWLQYRGQYGWMEKSRKELGVHQSVLVDQDLMNVISHPNQLNQPFLEKLKRNDVRKPLVATVLLMALISFEGGQQVTAMDEWTKSVYGDALFSRSLLLIASIIVAIIIPFTGYRRIVYVGLIFQSFSLVLYAATYALGVPTWRSIILAMISLSFDFGQYNLNDILLPYVFPVDVKGLANVGLNVLNWWSTFAWYIHSLLCPVLGLWIYLAYAVVDILVVLWMRSYLPECVGKGHSEIRRFFLEV